MIRMIRFLSFLIAACAALACVAWLPPVGAGPAQAEETHGLAMSDRQVAVTSQGRTATFRLYDTEAAREFYEQLPLTLDLTNFRDAQWMFYPPAKLHVTAREAYHDGKKGELSYYAPWGDAFMLYKDFHAGDAMHRLGVGQSGIEAIAGMSDRAVIEKVEPIASGETPMRMTVIANGNRVVFELNDSQAAKELLAQLPLDIGIENYGGIEKIFYPPKKLNTTDTPLIKSAQPGTLAYYAPWGDVVLFHGAFGSAAGLYELGHAVQGGEHIRSLSGAIRIER